ncbi:MAG: hypothetical protein COS72_01540 [Candidatus Moranbacteria bacterium CG06_land_8_20_14_3_00_43_56]|nr:MAG: hypothetical protein COS72_01540 [Candidatus Moranbacteria bacterium CG06_land_8_20_14_3_00_43_56]
MITPGPRRRKKYLIFFQRFVKIFLSRKTSSSVILIVPSASFTALISPRNTNFLANTRGIPASRRNSERV